MARIVGALGRPRDRSSHRSSPTAMRYRPDLTGRPGAVSPARPTYTYDVRLVVIVRSSFARGARPLSRRRPAGSRYRPDRVKSPATVRAAASELAMPKANAARNAVVVLLFRLVVSGKTELRKIDGWRKIFHR